MPLSWIIEQADLRTVLERLPDGMQTRLGGEGRLISGGEGQRAAVWPWDATPGCAVGHFG